MKNHLRAWLVTFGFGMKSKIDSADFIEQNSYEVGFAEFYKNKIKPSAASLEEIRIKHLRKISLRGRLVLLLWILFPIVTLIKIAEPSQSTSNGAGSVLLFTFFLDFCCIYRC